MVTNPFNLGRNKPNAQPEEPLTKFGVDVRLFGDRNSGKTTFIAALAYSPNSDPDGKIEMVSRSSIDAGALVSQAKRLLETGASFDATYLKQDVGELEDYEIRITFRQAFSQSQYRQSISQPIVLDISLRDYSGELFEKIRLSSLPLQDPVKSYIQNCAVANGILFLVDGTAIAKDQEYAETLRKLLEFLTIEKPKPPRPWKMALVMTKCEQAELLVNRHRPQFVAEARFGKVCQELEAWRQRGTIESAYFMVSAFGCVGGDVLQYPNVRKDDRTAGGLGRSYLLEPSKWRPFGLVSPMYWLCTGKRLRELDQE